MANMSGDNWHVKATTSAMVQPRKITDASGKQWRQRGGAPRSPAAVRYHRPTTASAWPERGSDHGEMRGGEHANRNPALRPRSAPYRFAAHVPPFSRADTS